VPQCDHGIDPHRPPRRNRAAKDRRANQ
jgi:hypothetical protein